MIQKVQEPYHVIHADIAPINIFDTDTIYADIVISASKSAISMSGAVSRRPSVKSPDNGGFL